jgi:hypothetical protein
MQNALEKIKEKYALDDEEQELKKMVNFTESNAKFRLDVVCENGFRYSMKFTSKESLAREVSALERCAVYDKRNFEIINL